MTTSIQTINDKGIDLDDGITACRLPNWRRAGVYCLEGPRRFACPHVAQHALRFAMPHRAASSAEKWLVKLFDISSSS